jgi:hypothetical protein
LADVEQPVYQEFSQAFIEATGLTGAIGLTGATGLTGAAE